MYYYVQWFLLFTLVVGFLSTTMVQTVEQQTDQQHLQPQAFASGIKRLPDIYWNTSNPIFRIDNTDHIVDVNEGRRGNNPMEYDQVNIVCPMYNKRLVPNEDETEKFVIYHVNHEEYDMCRIMNPHPRIIAVCDKPYSLSYLTISFRSFSPTPGALEFHAGKDYYFISTSSKGDLQRRQGGMCRTHNMRLVFKVADGVSNSQNNKEDRVDNQIVQSVPEPPNQTSLDNLPNNNKKNRKKKRRRKNRKNKNHNEDDSSASIVDSDYSEPSDADDVVHSAVSEDQVMNDKPRIRQKEPSLVEKVNNLMKQEASISSAASSNKNIFLLLSYMFIAAMITSL